ncbi:hypothetical protein [Prosthecobacter fluviatilis]|uniref:Uncharacterized protein n=1 Tax=Prosthecobacter fluviatilis TaxID=445931 RepID=A0ABW0KU46_9BACT
MNLAYRLLLPGLLLTLTAFHGHAQEAAGEDGDKRVQYQLVLPEEKTPENVKPEEHNPFESENEALSRQATGDTEENRVRDKLLKLPVVGTKRMADGRMRVLLGDIILETGRSVPPVLPDQLVELKVKNITPLYIELAWQEKRLTGLPPKIMTIPINIAPQVRYQMFGQTEEEAKESKGANAKMELSLRDPAANQPVAQQSAPPATSPATAPSAPGPMLSAEPVPPRALVVADDPVPFSPPRLVEPPASAPSTARDLAATPARPQPPPSPTAPTPAQPQPPPSPAVESVVRMLFGNPTPAPK